MVAKCNKSDILKTIEEMYFINQIPIVHIHSTSSHYEDGDDDAIQSKNIQCNIHFAPAVC